MKQQTIRLDRNEVFALLRSLVVEGASVQPWQRLRRRRICQRGGLVFPSARVGLEEYLLRHRTLGHGAPPSCMRFRKATATSRFGPPPAKASPRHTSIVPPRCGKKSAAWRACFPAAAVLLRSSHPIIFRAYCFRCCCRRRCNYRCSLRETGQREKSCATWLPVISSSVFLCCGRSCTAMAITCRTMSLASLPRRRVIPTRLSRCARLDWRV